MLAFDAIQKVVERNSDDRSSRPSKGYAVAEASATRATFLISALVTDALCKAVSRTAGLE